MQQITTHPFLKATPHFINRVVGQLFDDGPIADQHHKKITLLTPQPASQRAFFLREAIKHHYQVMLQATPRSKAGHTENIRGWVKPLNDHKYLISGPKIAYVLHFDQIRYLTRLPQAMNK